MIFMYNRKVLLSWCVCIAFADLSDKIASFIITCLKPHSDGDALPFYASGEIYDELPTMISDHFILRLFVELWLSDEILLITYLMGSNALTFELSHTVTIAFNY